MNFVFNAVAALVLGAGSQALAHGIEGDFKARGLNQVCDGFLPPNDLQIPVGSKEAGGITEEAFNRVLDRVEKVYGDEIRASGKNLVIQRKWGDGTVNAYASQDRSGNYHVHMLGGLARHIRITEEGFALVACHELGHHLGGAPKVTRFWFFTTWATNEGGSDYYATLKCLRRFYAGEDNASALAGKALDPVMVEACDRQYSAEEDRMICRRMGMGAMSVAYLFADLLRAPSLPTFATPDTNTVWSTSNVHPQPQCRMDTYFAGMLCPERIQDSVSNTDFRAGSCYAPRDVIGIRPACWFAGK